MNNPKALFAVFICLLLYPICATAQVNENVKESLFTPTIEVVGREDVSIFSPAFENWNLRGSSFTAGVESVTPSAKITGKFGINRGNTWGNSVYVDASTDSFNIGPVHFGGGLTLLIEKQTERVFYSPEPPSFEFKGEIEKGFGLVNLQTGIGNYSDNYFRVMGILGAGRITKRQRLYVNGKLTTPGKDQSQLQEDWLPMSGFGIEGGLNIWRNIRLEGRYVRLMTSFKIIPNTERLLPNKNNIIESRLNVYQSRYLSLGIFGSMADDSRGPVTAKRTAGIKIGLFPIKF